MRQKNVSGYNGKERAEQIALQFYRRSIRLIDDSAWNQRVLNDLYRARLSCCRMIRLHARPLPPFPSASCLFFQSSRAYRREMGRGVDESYDRKKAWPSINRSVLSAKKPPFQCKKGTLQQVFIRDWRYSQSCWYLRPSNLSCGSTLPPPFPSVNKYTVPVYSV